MSQAALSLKDLTNALNKVEDWEGLGIQLNTMSYRKFSKIAHQLKNVNEPCSNFGLKNGTKLSWETLITARGKLNLKNITEEVKQDYQVSSSTQPEADPPLVSENVTSADTLRTDPPSSPPTDQPKQAKYNGSHEDAAFIKACKGNPNLPPEFVIIKTKMGSEWQHHTLEETEEYRKSIAYNSSVANYALYVVAADLGSVYLVWSVSSHAIDFVVVAMSSEFFKHHCIEEVTIDGQDLKEYKHQHYYSFSHFKMISQVWMCV